MRLVAIITISLLSLAVAGETAYLVKLHRRVDALCVEVASVRIAAGGGAGGPRGAAGLGEDPDSASATAVSRAALRLKAQVAAGAGAGTAGGASDDPATPAVLQALALPEAKEKIRSVVGEELEKRKLQSEQKKNENVIGKLKIGQEVDRLARAAAPGMGIEGEDLQKLNELVGPREAARSKAMQEVSSGAKPREQADVEIEQLTDTVDKEVQALLGKNRYRQYHDFEKAETKRLKQAAKLAEIPPAQ